MLKYLAKTVLIGALIGQLLSSGCIPRATIKKPAYGPFLHDQPISAEALNDIKTSSPKDAVFADLLQAFALMRSGNIESKTTRHEILGLLQSSVSTFEDMRDPVNFSLAFSADEDKDFRGRPHERMLASTMAAVFLMGENRCGEALPYLRNAEFLDARFQKLPFGTDAPLIYALMYRCLSEQKAAKDDIDRAADGVFRSVRFLTLQEPLVQALVSLTEVDLRPLAISNRIAYMIYEISIYHSLLSAPNHFGVDDLLKDAAINASIFISTLNTHFEDEYKARMRPLIHELAKVYGMNNKEGIAHLENLAFEKISLEANNIGEKLTTVVHQHHVIKNHVQAAIAKTKSISDAILKSAFAPKMMVSFSGHGPTLVREGSYEEISVIRPSPEGSVLPAIRQKNLTVNTGCGFHRTSSGGFSVTFCKADAPKTSAVEKMPNLELLSMSRKATTAQGRKFDKVLKGRAQFRAATEKIAEISAWSAFFLFYLGSAMIADCQRRGEGQACYSRGLALWGIAGVTVLFSGTIWLIGRTRNPAADSRFIHLMYESAWVAI